MTNPNVYYYIGSTYLKKHGYIDQSQFIQGCYFRSLLKVNTKTVIVSKCSTIKHEYTYSHIPRKIIYE